MKSIDKLREIASRLDDAAASVSEHGFSPIAIKASLLCDEIEAEIAANYLELPKDADGVPIRVGDELIAPSGVKLKIHVIHLVDDVWWCGEVECVRYLANMCQHVKPRTLEDVLVDMLEAAIGYSDAHTDVALVAVEKYADEIRELLGGDADE